MTHMTSWKRRKNGHGNDTIGFDRTTAQTIVLVNHNWGGGTERHVHDMRLHLENAGFRVFILRILETIPPRILLSEPSQNGEGTDYCVTLPESPSALGQKLREIRTVHLHVHHVVGGGEYISDFIRLVAKHAGVAYDVTVHDYYLICPRINLIDQSGVYCGEPDVKVCERCVAANGSPIGKFPVELWREQSGRFLFAARKVFVPSRDVSVRLAKYFPALRFCIRPHPDDAASLVIRGIAGHLPARSARRVAVIGRIGPHKGSSVLYETAEQARRRRMPVTFVVVGSTDRDVALKELGNVELTGQYQEEDALNILLARACDVIWYPAVWPETYSYTLSLAFAAGLFPVAFNFGAIAERIRNASWGQLLPLQLLNKPAEIAEALLAIELPKLLPSQFSALSFHYQSFLRAYYDFEVDADIEPEMMHE